MYLKCDGDETGEKVKMKFTSIAAQCENEREKLARKVKFISHIYYKQHTQHKQKQHGNPPRAFSRFSDRFHLEALFFFVGKFMML